jgi:hypothetical protein
MVSVCPFVTSLIPKPQKKKCLKSFPKTFPVSRWAKTDTHTHTHTEMQTHAMTPIHTHTQAPGAHSMSAALQTLEKQNSPPCGGAAFPTPAVQRSKESEEREKCGDAARRPDPRRAAPTRRPPWRGAALAARLPAGAATARLSARCAVLGRPSCELRRNQPAPLPARLTPAARPALTSGVLERDIYGKETLHFP